MQNFKLAKKFLYYRAKVHTHDILQLKNHYLAYPLIATFFFF